MPDTSLFVTYNGNASVARSCTFGNKQLVSISVAAGQIQLSYAFPTTNNGIVVNEACLLITDSDDLCPCTMPYASTDSESRRDTTDLEATQIASRAAIAVTLEENR